MHSYLRENSINSITTQDVKYIKQNMLQARTLVPTSKVTQKQTRSALYFTNHGYKTYDGKHFYKRMMRKKGSYSLVQKEILNV